MVIADKDTLKLLVFLQIERLDPESEQYARFSDIILTMLGISDGDGNLTQEYRNSGFWIGGDDGTPLRPSLKAELSAMLPPELRHLLRSS